MKFKLVLSSTLILTLFYFSCISQNSSPGTGHVILNFGENQPRNKEDWDKPGHYEVISQLENAELDPGQPLQISIYLSGYGIIGGSKLFFSTTNNLFEPNVSYVLHSLKREGQQFSWGNDTVPLDDPSRFSFTVHAIKRTKWKESDMYVDANILDTQNFLILPELKLINPPVFIYLKSKDNAKPGNYQVSLTLTYFNGEQWQGATETINYKVRNWAEQFPKLIWIFAVLGALGVLLAFVQSVFDFIGKINKRKADKIKLIQEAKHSLIPENLKQSGKKKN